MLESPICFQQHVQWCLQLDYMYYIKIMIQEFSVSSLKSTMKFYHPTFVHLYGLLAGSALDQQVITIVVLLKF